MPRWKALPDSQDQRVGQLVVQLRILKDRSGLSVASLATKTGYSRSSWDRYLNGQALPPQRAVEELARAAGADPVRLRVLHEVASQAWRQPTSAPSPTGAGNAERREAPDRERPGSDRAAEVAPTPAEPVPASEPSVARGTARVLSVRRSVAVAGVLTAALVGVGAGMVIAAPWGGDDGAPPPVRTAATGPLPSTSATGPTGGPGRYRFVPGRTYSCPVTRADRTGGGLHAGYSTTRTAILAGPGWDVVEAQCLLRHHRMNPGVVDGIYGQQTIAAVVRLQKRTGLPPDGVVGPHVWQELRR
ncbi:helix-turn-helix domain-containing protein [Streptomyces sp. NPDC057702]|uniref:helix-turn-helix domain-containing protein n=1 Tax=unclassified Streptomyces TaxID=2593676 RepID=UPI0036C7369A